MGNFADRLISSVTEKGNPCIVGLDPRVELFPTFVRGSGLETATQACEAIREFNRQVLNSVSEHVAGVKLQVASYEKWGVEGIRAFSETIDDAKTRGLVVIVDAKRNDISTTADAYADAYLSTPSIPALKGAGFDVDCITVSPFLGADSLDPFVEACAQFGKGVFVLVKTSNRGSGDLQDLIVEGGDRVYERLARLVDRLGTKALGSSGYSSIGAVVGATYPEEAKRIRSLMPHAIILVPGYGAQGGTAQDAAYCFNRDGLGAVVSASRSITYDYGNVDVSEIDFRRRVRDNVVRMIADISAGLKARSQ